MQKQRSTTDTHRLPVEHSDAGIIKSMPHEIRIEDVNDANFIEAVEHKIVSASNLGDRFTEIRMDQYVHGKWCDDVIESIHVILLDESGDEITRLARDRTTSTRLTGYAHPYTGEKICVNRTWGDHVLFALCDLEEEMFDVHFLHYIICEDKGGLTRKEIMYSSPQGEQNIVDYLLSIWESPFPPGALNIIGAAGRARGTRQAEWRYL